MFLFSGSFYYNHWNKYNLSISIKWDFFPEMDTSGFELDVDTTDFILSTAHQKEDLIDR